MIILWTGRRARTATRRSPASETPGRASEHHQSSAGLHRAEAAHGGMQAAAVGQQKLEAARRPEQGKFSFMD